jgi:hypothetical protein
MLRQKYKAIPETTREEEHYPMWEEIPSSTKLAVFNFWYACNVINTT